ncbi:MAG: xanthine dehydrogenase family protein subunit M [Chloroflexi bacterium]|nr:xanthine dehydrogenase family protein subunit M [Chloroflexota bacterium]
MQYPRRLPRFEYLEPKSLTEACKLLLQNDGKARVVAGGTDLIPKMKRRDVNPRALISLHGIPGLETISHSQVDGLRLGPLTTLGAVESSTIVTERFNVLYQAVQSMASSQVRGLGTVAGNLCNAAPSADTAPALMVLGTRLKLISPQRERTVAAESFFAGPSATVLEPGEILAEIQIPEVPRRSAGVYIKHTLRRAMDLAIVGVAVAITLQDDTCHNVRIALGAVAPTPIRVPGAEAILKGKGRSGDLFRRAAKEAATACQPIDDVRGSADYRREMVEVLTRRALEQAWDRCPGSTEGKR